MILFVAVDRILRFELVKTMSVTIRLTKTGKKNSPAYRIVASQTRTKRNGKFLEILGEYNPSAGKSPNLNKAAIEAWIKKGALVTEPVKKMLEGTYIFKKYAPKKEQSKKPTEGSEETNKES